MTSIAQARINELDEAFARRRNLIARGRIYSWELTSDENSAISRLRNKHVANVSPFIALRRKLSVALIAREN